MNVGLEGCFPYCRYNCVLGNRLEFMLGTEKNYLVLKIDDSSFSELEVDDYIIQKDRENKACTLKCKPVTFWTDNLIQIEDRYYHKNDRLSDTNGTPSNIEVHSAIKVESVLTKAALKYHKYVYELESNDKNEIVSPPSPLPSTMEHIACITVASAITRIPSISKLLERWLWLLANNNTNTKDYTKKGYALMRSGREGSNTCIGLLYHYFKSEFSFIRIETITLENFDPDIINKEFPTWHNDIKKYREDIAKSTTKEAIESFRKNELGNITDPVRIMDKYQKFLGNVICCNTNCSSWSKSFFIIDVLHCLYAHFMTANLKRCGAWNTITALIEKMNRSIEDMFTTIIMPDQYMLSNFRNNALGTLFFALCEPANIEGGKLKIKKKKSSKSKKKVKRK